MGLERVDGSIGKIRNNESLCSARCTRSRQGIRNEERNQRIQDQPRQRRSKVPMPRRDPPLRRTPQDRIEVEPPEFRPEQLLPKVRINGHRDGQRGDEGAQTRGDDGSEGGLPDEEEVEGRRGEEEGDFGAEDGARDGEEGEGLLLADGAEAGGCLGEEEGCCECCWRGGQ